MNTQLNAMHESPLDGQGIAPAVMRATRPMYWAVRRELWENRSIYVAPLAAAAVYLLGFLISLARLPHKMRALAALDPAHQREMIANPYDFAAGLMMVTAMIVGAFYCLDALHGERRDRSILFWKSLPVSDTTTVLSKASIPLVALPLLTIAITVATQFIMLLVSSVALKGNGLSVTTYWGQLSLFQMSLMFIYHLLTVHVLGHAPFYGWMLLVSAWARRAAILWATLPLLAIGLVEKIAFNTSYFGTMLIQQLAGGAEAAPLPGRMPIDAMTHLTPGHFLISPNLWLGLALTAAFLFAAIRVRRNREPI
jgi:ABC-2 type transport system permease protein